MNSLGKREILFRSKAIKPGEGANAMPWHEARGFQVVYGKGDGTFWINDGNGKSQVRREGEVFVHERVWRQTKMTPIASVLGGAVAQE